MIRLRLPEPQPKQILFFRDQHRHVAFGGARGGGKSWAVRMKAILLCLAHPGITCMIVRKTYPELERNHIQQLRSILRVGDPQNRIASYNESKKVFRFENGSSIAMQYCDTQKDADVFQGAEVDVMFLDEATLLTEMQIRMINACVRGVNRFPHRTYYTCNPGGVSHGYIKRLFIDRQYEPGENPEDYSFIPSSVRDNKALMVTDPDYIRTLESLTPKLRAAWLDGRWDVFEGAFFEEFRERPDPQVVREHGIDYEEAVRNGLWTHVIEPFRPPSHWPIYRSYDWGSNKPFSVGWWAIDTEGCAYRICELYGCSGIANEGVHWTDEEQCTKIEEIEKTHPYLAGKTIRGVADPSCWSKGHDKSFVDVAERHGLWFEKGINDRIPGWMQVHERLRFDASGHPKMYFFNTCKDTIRTIPLMMYDGRIPEDMDSSLEDHICDDIRYFAMMNKIPARMLPRERDTRFDPLDQFKVQKKNLYGGV